MYLSTYVEPSTSSWMLPSYTCQQINLLLKTSSMYRPYVAGVFRWPIRHLNIPFLSLLFIHTWSYCPAEVYLLIVFTVVSYLTRSRSALNVGLCLDVVMDASRDVRPCDWGRNLIFKLMLFPLPTVHSCTWSSTFMSFKSFLCIFCCCRLFPWITRWSLFLFGWTGKMDFSGLSWGTTCRFLTWVVVLDLRSVLILHMGSSVALIQRSLELLLRPDYGFSAPDFSGQTCYLCSQMWSSTKSDDRWFCGTFGHLQTQYRLGMFFLCLSSSSEDELRCSGTRIELFWPGIPLF